MANHGYTVTLRVPWYVKSLMKCGPYLIAPLAILPSIYMSAGEWLVCALVNQCRVDGKKFGHLRA